MSSSKKSVTADEALERHTHRRWWRPVPRVCGLGQWHRGRWRAGMCNAAPVLCAAAGVILGLATGMLAGGLAGVVVGALLLGYGAFVLSLRLAGLWQIRQAWASGRSVVAPHPPTLSVIQLAAEACTWAATRPWDPGNLWVFEAPVEDGELEVEEAQALCQGAGLVQTTDPAERDLRRLALLLRLVGEQGFTRFLPFSLRPDAWRCAWTLGTLADALDLARTVADVPRLVALDRRLQRHDMLQFHAAALFAAETLVRTRDLGAFGGYLDCGAGRASDERDEMEDAYQRADDTSYTEAGLAVLQWYRERLKACRRHVLKTERGVSD